jgi:dGTPase
MNTLQDRDLSDIRCALEARECEWLDPRAARSAESKGRARPEASDPYRTEWQRDRDRIITPRRFVA